MVADTRYNFCTPDEKVATTANKAKRTCKCKEMRGNCVCYKRLRVKRTRLGTLGVESQDN